VLYDRQERASGEGKLTFMSRIKYAMDAITSFSYKPLRLSFGLAGFAISVAVILALCTVFSRSAINPLGYGVAAAIFLVGGFLLLCVGVLGEYLGRVYDEVRSRPLSIINKIYGPPQLISSQVTMNRGTMNRRIGDRRKPFRIA
jgi:dolichol-phosphate mannosyltransferase